MLLVRLYVDSGKISGLAFTVEHSGLFFSSLRNDAVLACHGLRAFADMLWMPSPQAALSSVGPLRRCWVLEAQGLLCPFCCPTSASVTVE